jgi:hypothetical protein
MPAPVTSDLHTQFLHVFTPILHMAMANEELYEALITLVLTFNEFRSGRLTMTPAIVYHNSESVAALRTKLRDLNTPPNDATMMTSVILSFVAVW